MCTIQEQSSRKSSLEGFLKKKRFFAHRKGGGNADSCELYWLIFWFHIVILCKISFHLIGHTIWFNTEIKFSYFEPPLLFCNGDSKNENLNSLQKYRVRPIKWKGILPRLTIWNQKLSQHTPVESALKMGLIFLILRITQKALQERFPSRLFLYCTHMKLAKLHKNPE